MRFYNCNRNAKDTIMKRIFTMLTMALMLATSCSAQSLPDKKTLNAIKKADKMLYYSLDPMSEDFSNGSVQGVAVIGQETELPNDKKDTLLSLIQECVANYNPKGATKMSAFIPESAFSFIRGNDTVNLLLDFHADMMSFNFGNKHCSLDFDSRHDKWVGLIKSLFGTEDSAPLPDSVTESIVPQEILKNIAAADSVTWFILDPMDRATENLETFNGTLVLLRKDEKETAEISSLLTSPSSFVKSDVFKDCIFFPDLGIRMYVDDNQFVDIMFSFYCNECKIMSGEKTFQADCQIIRGEIIKLFRKKFPTDRYLRTLSNH